MARIVGKKRQDKLNKLNQIAKRKASRLQKNYNIDVELEVRTASSFNSIKEFNQYIKRLETFTDRKTHRYTKLANDTVIDYSLFLEWRRGQRQLNKENKKALEKRLKLVGTKYTYADLVDDPFKAYELNLEWLLPNATDINSFKKTYKSGYSVKRNIGYTDKKLEENFANKRDQQFKENFTKAIDTYFVKYFASHGVKIGSKARRFQEFIDNLSMEQFQQVYYGMTEDPFEFVYDPGALVYKFNGTIEKFRRFMTDKQYDFFQIPEFMDTE